MSGHLEMLDLDSLQGKLFWTQKVAPTTFPPILHLPFLTPGDAATSSQPCRAPSLPYLWSSAAAADSCTCDIPPQASASTNPGRVWQELLNFWCSGAWETTRSERQGKSEKATTWKKKRKGLVFIKIQQMQAQLMCTSIKTTSPSPQNAAILQQWIVSHLVMFKCNYKQ